ncbi:hypothetical protein [Massilia sp. DD77]|uniref:hypothetical protein n=1 Tax=Massilia sp. DD77 TaxID=3109349 RepID=UPI00300008EE
MMKTIWITLVFACAAAALPSHADELGPHKKLTGVYRVYGGGLGDPSVPTPQDKKVMFSISGAAAKEIFNAIGPDKKDICTEGSSTRVRSKDDGNLSCLRSAKGEYSCNFGFDLVSGKSIGGIVC